MQIRIVQANAEGGFSIIYGKSTAAGEGFPASGNYVGVSGEGSQIVSATVCRDSVVSTLSFLPVSIPSPTVNITILSESGNSQFFANGILIGSSTLAPNAAFSSGSISIEVENGASATTYQIFVQSQSECN